MSSCPFSLALFNASIAQLNQFCDSYEGIAEVAEVAEVAF
jgi:hypothetical protein